MIILALKCLDIMLIVIFDFDTVLTNYTLMSRESLDCSVFVNSTMVPLSVSIRLHWTWWKRFFLSSPSVTQLDKLLRSLSSREVSLRLTVRESPLLITVSLKNHLASTTWIVSRTSSTKSLLVDLLSRKLTTSCGHSSLTPQEVVTAISVTPSTKVVTGVTEKSSSTT
jgi:hypothetical protein